MKKACNIRNLWYNRLAFIKTRKVLNLMCIKIENTENKIELKLEFTILAL